MVSFYWHIPSQNLIIIEVCYTQYCLSLTVVLQHMVKKQRLSFQNNRCHFDCFGQFVQFYTNVKPIIINLYKCIHEYCKFGTMTVLSYQLLNKLDTKKQTMPIWLSQVIGIKYYIGTISYIVNISGSFVFSSTYRQYLAIQ